MEKFTETQNWAIILGGSSGFGLATAKKLSSQGMNVCIVHRDRRASMPRIEAEFAEIASKNIKFKSFNTDALDPAARQTVLDSLRDTMGEGRVRVLLHSIAFGSLKLLAPLVPHTPNHSLRQLAFALDCNPEQMQQEIDTQFSSGAYSLASLASPPSYNEEFLLTDSDVSDTIFAMGTSLLSWTRDLFQRKMFCADARVLGLTSEGNEVAWYGYAAVSAAKVALEAMSRSIAKEFAPYGIRSNIVQPGVTDTPALRLIPGCNKMLAHAMQKNPFSRLTTPEDVANVISLLASDDAAWINGSVIRVDGGERISG